VNADKTKYMVMSREQDAGRSHNIKTDNISFVRVEEFKYLGTTLTIQNSILEEIKEEIEDRECLLSFGSESFAFQFAIQKFKIRIYKTIIMPVVLYGCETWKH